MKRTAVIALALLCAAGIWASAGYGHNNSAPTFECITCHEGDMVADLVRIQGVPKTYVPGKVYQLTVVVADGRTSGRDVAGGFAVEASAGDLIVKDKKHTQLSDAILTHTQEGSALRKWTFGWKAPSAKTEASISVMALAANGDFSPAGDQVGSTAYLITPAQ